MEQEVERLEAENERLRTDNRETIAHHLLDDSKRIRAWHDAQEYLIECIKSIEA